MGFTPAQVRAMSLWEFSCCCAGYRGKPAGASGETLSDEALRASGVIGF